MKKKTIAIGAGSIAIALACGSALWVRGCSTSLGGASHRAILGDPGGYYSPTYWRVSRTEAKRADDGVRAFLMSRHSPILPKFDGYYGQIFGTKDPAGRPLIHLNYFCASFIRDEDYIHIGMLKSLGRPLWTYELVEVDDGGECFFNVDFDPGTGAYENFRVNGEA